MARIRTPEAQGLSLLDAGIHQHDGEGRAVILAKARIQVARVPYPPGAGFYQHDGVRWGVILAYARIQVGKGWKSAGCRFLPPWRSREGRPKKCPNNPQSISSPAKKRHPLYRGNLGPRKKSMGHKNNLVEGFTKKYDVHLLVWYEMHETMETAISREKALKYWKRDWKLELIEKDNPRWMDLYETIV